MVGLLDAPDRDVYSLRFMEGLELAEIASAMHVSLSTVRRTLRRAVHRVGVLLQLDPVLSGYADAARAAPQRRPSR
jgi:RNA polymerase sigma-70 factor (ECF subfamily)